MDFPTFNSDFDQLHEVLGSHFANIVDGIVSTVKKKFTYFCPSLQWTKLRL